MSSDGYVKVFKHNTAGGLFSNAADVLNKNLDNPDADLFSILDQLEDFRNADGKFQFKLCYPELTGAGGGSCNVWIQTNNPATDSGLSGFEPITLAFNSRFDGDAWTGAWTGLGRNVGDSDWALIDDFPNKPIRNSAIGAFHFLGDSETIPGPLLDSDNLETSRVTKVELYVRKYQDSTI